MNEATQKKIIIVSASVLVILIVISFSLSMTASKTVAATTAVTTAAAATTATPSMSSVKLASGSITLPGSTLAANWGSIQGSFTFPSGLFTTVPSVTLDAGQSSGQAQYIKMQLYSCSSTGGKFALFNESSSSQTFSNYTIYWSAIGT